MTCMRKRKDNGGYSECSSPLELVGKGRCCHIEEEGVGKMEISKIQRGMYNIQVEESSLTIEAQKDTIIDFFEKMPKISEEKQRKIIDFLQDQ